MKGYKTWIAAIGVAASGVALCAQAFGETFDPVKFWEGVTVISGALALVGIGHKIEKQ